MKQSPGSRNCPQFILPSSHGSIARILATLLLLVAVAVGGYVASAAVIYDEAIDGDFSGDRSNPTSLGTLDMGTHSLTATSLAGDLEYVTFTIPAGRALGSLNLTGFVGLDDVGFLAIQSGSVFTVTPAEAAGDVSVLLGYTHFGSGGLAGTAVVGTDILDELGSGPGSTGFTPPLAAGNYTLWIQQTQATPTTYSLDLVVVPEPAEVGVAVGALLLGGMLLRRLRRTGRGSGQDSPSPVIR